MADTKPVALKRISLMPTLNPPRSPYKEATLMLKLRHPSVLAADEIYAERKANGPLSQLYLITDPLETSLKVIIARGSLQMKQIEVIAFQIAAGLNVRLMAG